MITHTRTYAILELSEAAYQEIADKLRAAGYHQTFHETAKGRAVIDMHGIAVAEHPAKDDSGSVNENSCAHPYNAMTPKGDCDSCGAVNVWTTIEYKGPLPGCGGENV